MTEEKIQAAMAAQPSATLGARLQARREELGWSLEDIESRLKIRRTTLQAIEGERYSELPDKVYALGFIKSYARFLDLDVEAIMQQANAELASFIPKRQTVRLDLPGPQAERSVGLWVLLAIGLIVIIGGYVGWYHFYAHGRLGASIFPSHLSEKMADDAAVPSHPASNVPAPSPAVTPAAPVQLARQASSSQDEASHPADQAAVDQTQAAAAKPDDGQKDEPDLPPPPETVAPAGDGSAAATEQDQPRQSDHQAGAVDAGKGRQAASDAIAPRSEPKPQPASQAMPKAADRFGMASAVQPQASSPATATPAPVPVADGTPAQVARPRQESGDVVQIHALEDSWVHVVDASGKSLIGHVLKSGDVWQGDPGATYHVTSGNAGGVVLQAGNVVSAPLGLRGKIARDVVVNAALVEQGHFGHGSLSAGAVMPKAHR